MNHPVLHLYTLAHWHFCPHSVIVNDLCIYEGERDSYYLRLILFVCFVYFLVIKRLQQLTSQTTATLQKCLRLTPLTSRFSPITGGPVWPSTRTRSCTIPTRFPCSTRRATAAWWAQAAATTRSMFSPPPWRGWSSPRLRPRSHTQGECKHSAHTAHTRYHCKRVHAVLIFWHLLDCFMCSGNTLDSLLLSIALINDAVSWHMAFLWL